MTGYRDNAQSARAQLRELESQLAEITKQRDGLSRDLANTLENKHETDREWKHRLRRRLLAAALGALVFGSLVAIVGIAKHKGGLGANITIGLVVAFMVLIPFSAAGRLDELVEPMARAPKRNRAQLDRLLAEVTGTTVDGVDITAPEARIAELANESAGLEREIAECKTLLAAHTRDEAADDEERAIEGEEDADRQSEEKRNA